MQSFMSALCVVLCIFLSVNHAFAACRTNPNFEPCPITDCDTEAEAAQAAKSCCAILYSQVPCDCHVKITYTGLPAGNVQGGAMTCTYKWNPINVPPGYQCTEVEKCDGMRGFIFYTSCAETEEKCCDGIDNDCDGIVDEGCNPCKCSPDCEGEGAPSGNPAGGPKNEPCGIRGAGQ